MTNRERFIDALNGECMEDDCGAADESFLVYGIACPYFDGDPRCKCKDGDEPDRWGMLQGVQV